MHIVTKADTVSFSCSVVRCIKLAETAKTLNTIGVVSHVAHIAEIKKKGDEYVSVEMTVLVN